MTDTLSVALGMFAALAPFGGMRVFLAEIMTTDREARPADAARPAVLGGFAALAILGIAVAAADPFLKAISVSGSSFLFAAGAAMAPVAARLILTGESMATPEPAGQRRIPAWLAPVGTPLLAGPAVIVATVAYSAHYGEGEALAGAAVGVVLAAVLLCASPWLVDRLGGLGLGILGRLSGALLVAIAVSLAVSGVHNV